MPGAITARRCCYKSIVLIVIVVSCGAATTTIGSCRKLTSNWISWLAPGGDWYLSSLSLTAAKADNGCALADDFVIPITS